MLKSFSVIRSSLAAMVCLVLVSTASATIGIGSDYVHVTANGSGTWYNVGTGTIGTASPFEGLNLGAYDPATDSLSITDVQINTFKSGPGNVTNSDLFYNIHLMGSSDGPFTQLSLGFGHNVSTDGPFTDIGGQNFPNGGDQRWQGITPTANLVSGLADGNYVLEVYSRITGTDGGSSFNVFNSNTGDNFSATFSVVTAAVPEPSAFLFGGLICGIVGLVQVVRVQVVRKRCCASVNSAVDTAS